MKSGKFLDSASNFNLILISVLKLSKKIWEKCSLPLKLKPDTPCIFQRSASWSLIGFSQCAIRFQRGILATADRNFVLLYIYVCTYVSSHQLKSTSTYLNWYTTTTSPLFLINAAFVGYDYASFSSASKRSFNMSFFVS